MAPPDDATEPQTDGIFSPTTSAEDSQEGHLPRDHLLQAQNASESCCRAPKPPPHDGIAWAKLDRARLMLMKLA